MPTRHPGPRPRTGLRSTWAWGSSIISTRRGDRARKLDRSVNPASRVRLPFRALGSWVSVSGPGGAARAGGFSSRPQAPAQPCLLQTLSPRLQGWRTRDVGERRASCCGGRWPWGLRGDGQAVSGGGWSVLTLRLGGSRRPAVTRRQAAAAGASLPGDEGVTGSAAAPGPAHSRARPPLGRVPRTAPAVGDGPCIVGSTQTVDALAASPGDPFCPVRTDPTPRPRGQVCVAQRAAEEGPSSFSSRARTSRLAVCVLGALPLLTQNPETPWGAGRVPNKNHTVKGAGSAPG